MCDNEVKKLSIEKKFRKKKNNIQDFSLEMVRILGKSYKSLRKIKLGILEKLNFRGKLSEFLEKSVRISEKNTNRPFKNE